MSSGNRRNVYVRNIGPEADDHDLYAAFQQFGSIESAKVCRDIYEGKSRGFGFVLYADPGAAAAAVASRSQWPAGWTAEIAKHDGFNVITSSTKCYARNIPTMMHEHEVYRFFAHYGPIKSFTVKPDSSRAPKPFKKSGTEKPQCNVCFIEFESAEGAKNCREQTYQHVFEGASGPLMTKFAETEHVRDERRHRRDEARKSQLGPFHPSFGSAFHPHVASSTSHTAPHQPIASTGAPSQEFLPTSPHQYITQPMQFSPSPAQLQTIPMPHWQQPQPSQEHGIILGGPHPVHPNMDTSQQMPPKYAHPMVIPQQMSPHQTTMNQPPQYHAFVASPHQYLPSQYTPHQGHVLPQDPRSQQQQQQTQQQVFFFPNLQQ